MAEGIGMTCKTPSDAVISARAVQPWKVRNAEHITVEGYSSTSVLYAPSQGS